jgi:hypothetical protein
MVTRFEQSSLLINYCQMNCWTIKSETVKDGDGEKKKLKFATPPKTGGCEQATSQFILPIGYLRYRN